MDPLRMPNFSWITLTTGPRQLVVQDAFEMMLCLAGSYMASLTPSTRVKSSFLAGAEMMTFLTGPRMCFTASLASVNLPVDSMTISAPTDAQSSSAGSFWANTLIVLPPTEMESACATTSWGKVPSTESYLSRCAKVFVSVRSFTATNSTSFRWRLARTTLRPMRPKPLMPTFTAMFSPIDGCEGSDEGPGYQDAGIRGNGRHGDGEATAL